MYMHMNRATWHSQLFLVGSGREQVADGTQSVDKMLHIGLTGLRVFVQQQLSKILAMGASSAPVKSFSLFRDDCIHSPAIQWTNVSSSKSPGLQTRDQASHGTLPQTDLLSQVIDTQFLVRGLTEVRDGSVVGESDTVTLHHPGTQTRIHGSYEDRDVTPVVCQTANSFVRLPRCLHVHTLTLTHRGTPLP